MITFCDLPFSYSLLPIPHSLCYVACYVTCYVTKDFVLFCNQKSTKKFSRLAKLALSR